jgi:hypothetical protein
LGYTYLSARQTVQRTITWLVEHGFVNERRRQVILKTTNAWARR